MTRDTRIMLNIGAPILGGLLALFAAAALCGCSTAKACPDHPQSPCLTTGDIVVAVVVAVASILIVVTGVYMARREELSYYS